MGCLRKLVEFILILFVLIVIPCLLAFIPVVGGVLAIIYWICWAVSFSNFVNKGFERERLENPHDDF